MSVVWSILVLALGAGFAVAHALLADRSPSFPPVNGFDWLCYIAPAVGVVGALEAVRRWRMPQRFVVIFVVSAATVFLLVHPLASRLSIGEQATWAAALGVGTAVCWWLFDRYAERTGGALPAALLLLTACAATVVLALSGSMVFPKLSGVLTGILLVAWLLVWMSNSQSLRRGTQVLFYVLLLGLLVCSRFYTVDANIDVAGILLVASPVMGWLGWMPGVRGLKPRTNQAVTIVAVLVPLGVAIAWAILHQPEPSPYG
jgi:hypothetical protein